MLVSEQSHNLSWVKRALRKYQLVWEEFQRTFFTM